MNTASLPIVTPCSLVPISQPHIQAGREISTAFVVATCGTSIHVQRTVPPSGARAGHHSRTWASLGSRSEFLANQTRSSSTTTTVSHIGAAVHVRTNP